VNRLVLVQKQQQKEEGRTDLPPPRNAPRIVIPDGGREKDWGFAPLLS
jgi:hypothetical protein